MTKKDIAQRLLELNDNSPFIAVRTIMKVAKIGHGTCLKLVEGLDSVSGPKHGDITTRLYFIDDVAQRIMERGLTNGEN